VLQAFLQFRQGARTTKGTFARASEAERSYQ
jgi:hypothetical protein